VKKHKVKRRNDDNCTGEWFQQEHIRREQVQNEPSRSLLNMHSFSTKNIASASKSNSMLWAVEGTATPATSQHTSLPAESHHLQITESVTSVYNIQIG